MSEIRYVCKWPDNCRCAECETRWLTRELIALRAENARLRRIEAAARELFRALDNVTPGWREDTCIIDENSDEVNVAWATLEHVLIAPAALAALAPKEGRT